MNEKYWEFEQMVTANRAGIDNCSACDLNGVGRICNFMTCRDSDFRPVFWTVPDAKKSEVNTLWGNYTTVNSDIRGFCLSKIAEAYRNS